MLEAKKEANTGISGDGGYSNRHAFLLTCYSIFVIPNDEVFFPKIMEAIP